MAKGTLKVNRDGTLVADEEAHASLGLGTRDEFDVTAVVGKYALLRAGGDDASIISEPGIVFTGSMESLPAPDVISQVNTMGRDGCLTFVFGDIATKSLFFKRGEVVFANSTLKDDRLGECLVRIGKLSQDQLQTASMLIGGGVKLGKALVDSKMITPHELWEGLKAQVEQIFLSVFQYNQGSFAFTDGELNLRTEVRLPMPTTHYILEGVATFDELKEDFEKVSHRMTILTTVPETQWPDEEELSGLERDVLSLVDGKRNVRDLLARSPWSEHYTLLALARLSRQGIVLRGKVSQRPEPEANPAEVDQALAREKISRANKVLAQIYEALHKQERDNARNILNSFFDDLKPKMRPLFALAQFDGSGQLDTDAIIANLIAAEHQTPDKYLMRGLSDLIGFALFTAGDLLPSQETDRLVEVVAHWSDASA